MPGFDLPKWESERELAEKLELLCRPQFDSRLMLASLLKRIRENQQRSIELIADSNENTSES